MFLLALAHLGCPRQNLESCKTVVVVVVVVTSLPLQSLQVGEGPNKEPLGKTEAGFLKSTVKALRELYITYRHTTILQLYRFCPGQPGWAGTRRDIHALNPIMVINCPLSASSNKPHKFVCIFNCKILSQINRFTVITCNSWFSIKLLYLVCCVVHTLQHSVLTCTVLSSHMHLLFAFLQKHTQLFYGPLGFCPGLPGSAGTRKVKSMWIYCSKRQWVAVASAGVYANLHFDLDTQPHQYATIQLFTGRMSFLPHNQQHQSTEGNAFLQSVHI